MTLLTTLGTALRGILANKLRSALTMLGVIIGVASVIAMLALGNGARAAVGASFRALGSDQVQIRQNMRFEGGQPVPEGAILSYEDGLHMPGAVELVERVAMSVSRVAKVRHGRTVRDILVTGATADALSGLISGASAVVPADWTEGEPLVPSVLIDRGRFFTPAEVLETGSVCVLGHQAAEDLFRGDDPVGETVRVNRKHCLVVGVLVALEVVDPEQRGQNKPNESFYMPISTAIQDFCDEDPSVSITAYVSDESRMGEAKAQIARYLRQRHDIQENGEGDYEDDFVLTTRDDVLGVQQETARTFALLLAALATISLIVGGIGIMNVMLVSVTERTREIGIRLAVGACQRDIVWQFLLEAALISAIGGAQGIAVGILAVPLAAMLNQGHALLAPGSIPLSFGIALVTGVLFGLYPAIRASRLEPIAALGYE